MIKQAVIHTRNVSSSVSIRHIVKANVEARSAVSLNLVVRRGPKGEKGDDGDQGPPGNLENMRNVNLSGGFF